MDNETAVEEIALWWAVRTIDPAFDDWDSLLSWLDGEPAKNHAYDRAMAIITASMTPSAQIVQLRTPLASNDVYKSSAGRRRWFIGAAGSALVACAAAVMFFVSVDPEPSYRAIETSPGKPQTIALKDHSRIEISGGSRILLNPLRPRWAKIDFGRVVFTVHHNSGVPYEVAAGPYKVVDVGTVFEIEHKSSTTRVAVAEGAVIIDPKGLNLSLAEGQAATLHPGKRVSLQRLPTTTVGAWRQLNMRYDDAPLSRVAADLSTALGLSIVLEPNVANSRFTGTISPATLKNNPSVAAALLNVRIVAYPRGWRLSAL